MKKGSKGMKKAYKDNYSEVEEEGSWPLDSKNSHRTSFIFLLSFFLSGVSSERILAVIASLLQHLKGQDRLRLLAKFVETDFEKSDRLVDLHFVYLGKVASVNQSVEEQKRKLLEEGEEVDEGEFYLTRLDGGLFILQIIDHILLHICTCEEDSSVKFPLSFLFFSSFCFIFVPFFSW